MSAFEIILIFNILLVYVLYFQVIKMIKEIRKDVDRGLCECDAPEDEEADLFRTKDSTKKN